MAIHNHTSFTLGKASKMPREINGKSTKLIRREILAGGQTVGALEIPGGQVVDFGYLRDTDDSIILRWDKPKRTQVEFFFYDANNQPKGSLKMISGLISKNREFNITDAQNNLIMRFKATDNKMSKEKNAGTFTDLQENVVGRTWTKWKDPASGMKGPFIEAMTRQDLILASILQLARHTGWNPIKY